MNLHLPYLSQQLQLKHWKNQACSNTILHNVLTCLHFFDISNFYDSSCVAEVGLGGQSYLYWNVRTCEGLLIAKWDIAQKIIHMSAPDKISTRFGLSSRHPKDGTFIPATLGNPRDKPTYSQLSFEILWWHRRLFLWSPRLILIPYSKRELPEFAIRCDGGFAKLYIIGLIT